MVRRSRLFICMFFLISLNKINALIVFEFSDRFCFMSCFQNVSSPKMRNVLMLQGRLWFLGALCTVLPSVLWRCWLGGRKGIWPVKNEWWGADVVICLEWGADLHYCIWSSWCHCHSLSLASVKSRLVLPFWYRLTQVDSEKGLLNVCMCMYVCTVKNR